MATRHAHAVTHINDSQKYWYDENGNMITRTVGTDSFNLSYDAENRLVSASTTQPASPNSWYDTDWDYRRSVAANYSGSPLSNYDVLIEIDTASLVTTGKMQADCDDLRVTDSDMTTPLNYWIEGGLTVLVSATGSQQPIYSFIHPHMGVGIKAGFLDCGWVKLN